MPPSTPATASSPAPSSSRASSPELPRRHAGALAGLLKNHCARDVPRQPVRAAIRGRASRRVGARGVLRPVVVVLQSDDVVLLETRALLYLDDAQCLVVGILNAMDGSFGIHHR